MKTDVSAEHAYLRACLNKWRLEAERTSPDVATMLDVFELFLLARQRQYRLTAWEARHLARLIRRLFGMSLRASGRWDEFLRALRPSLIGSLIDALGFDI